jgi:hypothetical protein
VLFLSFFEIRSGMNNERIIVPSIIIEYMFIDISPAVKATLPMVTPTAPRLPMIPVPVMDLCP